MRRPGDEETKLGPVAMDRSFGALRLIEFVEDTALWAKRQSHCCREDFFIVYA